MKFIKNYKSTLILMMSIVLGALVGMLFGDKASVLKPFGDLFLNMLLVVIVPLVFLSISISIYKMKQPKRIGKILITTFVMFIVTSVVAALIGLASTYAFKLVDTGDGDLIKEELSMDASSDEENLELNLLEKTVSMISVDDFSKLLSRDNMIALIVISMLVGFSMNMAGDKAIPVFRFMDSANVIVNNLIKLIMYYAPIGIASYFASLIGTFGSTIAVGYLRTFIIYTLVALFFYFVVYSVFAYISAGIKGVRAFWMSILPSTLTALSTCSSAASIPINIECTKNIGVSSDIAETTVSLGTSFHKDGSVIASVFKIMFLVHLFNDMGNMSVFQIVAVAIVATLLITAVPIGGGTIAEMFIITMIGYPVATLPILTMIATIIDAPTTVLNVVGDSASAMMTSRIVDGKNWLKEKAS